MVENSVVSTGPSLRRGQEGNRKVGTCLDNKQIILLFDEAVELRELINCKVALKQINTTLL
jgi:hypothetical protein